MLPTPAACEPDGHCPHRRRRGFVGDDPGAKSSTFPCASEHTLADLGIPTFYPADAADILDLGRHAVAMSRASGLWSALKIVTAVADGSTVVDLGEAEAEPILPEGSQRHRPSAKLIQPTLGAMEQDAATTRLSIVEEYASRNKLNPVTSRHENDRTGILAAGKTYSDVCEALAELGLNDEELAKWGIRLMKVGLVWPLAERDLRDFAVGLRHIVVVEEKRGFLETAVRRILYGSTRAPLVEGKQDREGARLFASFGELDPDTVAAGLARVLLRDEEITSVRGWLAEREARSERRRRLLPVVPLTPRTPTSARAARTARLRGLPRTRWWAGVSVVTGWCSSWMPNTWVTFSA